MIIGFAILSLVIFLITKKNMAASASVGFFVAWNIQGVETYEMTVLLFIMLQFILFLIAFAEFKLNRTVLSRVLMWLYLSALAVTVSYTIETTVAQGHILIAMSVVELLALSVLDGCRSLYGDVELTFRDIRSSVVRSLHTDDSEGGK